MEIVRIFRNISLYFLPNFQRCIIRYYLVFAINKIMTAYKFICILDIVYPEIRCTCTTAGSIFRRCEIDQYPIITRVGLDVVWDLAENSGDAEFRKESNLLKNLMAMART